MVLNKKTQKSDYVDIRKLNDNFYILIRKKRYWNIKEIKFIKKYLNYKIFYPIPKNYIDISIFGYNCEYGYYEKSCPKYILFNLIKLLILNNEKKFFITIFINNN